jgi:hypothetical protein
MALELKFNVTKTADCKEFIFTQTTGTYDVTTNLTGWGAPNVDIGNAQDSYVVIQDLTSSTIYKLIEVAESDDSATNFLYEDLIIEGQSLPIGTEEIVDGIYCFTHTVLMDDDSLYNTTGYHMSLCQLECKLKELSSKYIASLGSCSSCESKLLNFFSEAMALYDALKFSYRCGNFTHFNKILINLQSLLLQLDCSNC